MNKQEKIKYFNDSAKDTSYWKKKNWYYHNELFNLFSFIIPSGCTLLEIGCGTGETISKLKPRVGIGVDISEEMIKIAKNNKPEYNFMVGDIEDLKVEEKFDFVILSDLIGHLSDVWLSFRQLHKVTTKETRIVITYYNYLWEPLLKLAEKLRLKMPQYYLNWLSLDDIENLLNLNGFEVIKKGSKFLFPVYIPLFSNFINKYIAKLWPIRKLCLIKYIVAREIAENSRTEEYSCSVIVPCRNEAGNIEGAVRRTPRMGKFTEIIFVDGDSTDGTIEKIKMFMNENKDLSVKLIHQGNASGKADAVQKGFSQAKGDILMILDADLTVPPEDLPKFYLALAEGKGEFINGTRLVYPMEKEAMRPLNLLGNKMFSLIFSWILEQRIKDTLCGTKALFRKDYLKIEKGRSFFGNFDPFGDFDLLFGAAKLNLKIVEMPVMYKERTYGDVKIRRFQHGWLLLRMSLIAFNKFKLS